ncbi:MAG: amino acid permease, partial [Kiritimatiellae bacterium]|nr:amino acid permease [Kiritimatiellia bacterium]
MRHHLQRHITPLGAWALAFGCAIGLDAFSLPVTSLLPNAGPVGTIIGILAGAAAMAALAWNYHFMMRHQPDGGGAYSFAAKTFGRDHGFLCGWFLILAYGSIVWMDAISINSLAHYLSGDLVDFGFSYTIGGHVVHLGQILLSAASTCVALAISLRPRLAVRVQTAMALLFAAGVVVCFAAAALANPNGVSPLSPPFANNDAGLTRQVFRIIAMSLWLFVGFESISHATPEFRFPARRSFAVMALAIAAVTVCYILLLLLPALNANPGEAWDIFLWNFSANAYPALSVAGRPLGAAAKPILAVTGASAVFTNLIGNTFAITRLLAAMSEDGAFRPWLSRRNASGAPVAAIAIAAAVSCFTPALGGKVIGIVVDIAIVGASLAYAYTSAATAKVAAAEGNRAARATGILCLILAITVSVIFVLPVFSGDTTNLATESYLLLVIWCIVGLICFLAVFRRDQLHRFGRSPVVWISLLLVIIVVSHIWIRKSAEGKADRTFSRIISIHDAGCISTHAHGHGSSWRRSIRSLQHQLEREVLSDSLVQSGLTILAIATMFCIYYILRRREREIEQEKARAKSYFFSTVSHDIRTPLNAIIGFSEMLKAGLPSEAERAQALDSILVSGKTLLALINDVLDLSKIESGKMEISPEPTDVAALLRGVLDAFHASGAKPGVELRCRIGEMPPLMLDPQRIRQIVFNLMGNAVKFTEKGHVELRAAFLPAKDADGGRFRLEVEDTGCGISEDDLRNIGSAYVQVGSRKARNGGTGLGLAICRQLAVAMGGKLGVTSRLGAGTTFSLEIRRINTAPASEDQAPLASEDQAPPASEDQAPPASEDQAPLGSEDQAPLGSEDQAPLGSDGQAPLGSDGQAAPGQRGPGA